MNVLTEEIFVPIQARRSLVAKATKASTQRRAGQKEPVKMFMNVGYSVLKTGSWFVQYDRVEQNNQEHISENPYTQTLWQFSESGFIQSSTSALGYWEIVQNQWIRILPRKGEAMLKKFEGFRGDFLVESTSPDEVIFKRILNDSGTDFLTYTLVPVVLIRRFTLTDRSSGQIPITLEHTKQDIEDAVKEEYFLRNKRLPSDFPTMTKKELFDLYSALFQ